MPERTTPTRQCPTPQDGRDPLIAHQIDAGTCARRQAGQYHKCFSCEHFAHSAHPSVEIPPLPPSPPPRIELRPAPAPRPQGSPQGVPALRVG